MWSQKRPCSRSGMTRDDGPGNSCVWFKEMPNSDTVCNICLGFGGSGVNVCSIHRVSWFMNSQPLIRHVLHLFSAVSCVQSPKSSNKGEIAYISRGLNWVVSFNMLQPLPRNSTANKTHSWGMLRARQSFFPSYPGLVKPLTTALTRATPENDGSARTYGSAWDLGPTSSKPSAFPSWSQVGPKFFLATQLNGAGGCTLQRPGLYLAAPSVRGRAIRTSRRSWGRSRRWCRARADEPRPAAATQVSDPVVANSKRKARMPQQG